MKINEIISESQRSLWSADELPKIKDPNRSSRVVATGGVPRTYPKWDDGPMRMPLDPNSQSLDIDKNAAKNKFGTSTRTGRQAATTEIIPDIKPEINDSTRKRFQEVFTGFQSSAREQNRTPKYSVYKNSDPTKATFGLWSKTDNGVDVAIGSTTSGKFAYYTVEERDQERREAIRSILEDNDFKYLSDTETKFRFMIKDPDDMDSVFSDFWKIMDCIEELGDDFKSPSVGKGAGSLLPELQAPEQYYRWLAKNIFNSVKENYSWGFSRGGEGGPYDKYDDLITIGITPGGIKQQKEGRPAYREHVVPCDYINRMAITQCKDMMKKNIHPSKIVRSLMELIHKNLAIVLCSSPPLDNNKKPIKDPDNPTEQEIVDKKYSTTMPSTWDGENIFARFTEYKIPVYLLKNGDHRGKQIA